MPFPFQHLDYSTEQKLSTERAALVKAARRIASARESIGIAMGDIADATQALANCPRQTPVNRRHLTGPFADLADIEAILASALDAAMPFAEREVDDELQPEPTSQPPATEAPLAPIEEVLAPAPEPTVGGTNTNLDGMPIDPSDAAA